MSDNGTGESTLYNSLGQKQSLVVTIPPASGTGLGTPTGVIGNTTASSFVVSIIQGGVTKSGKALFLFATQDGTISGWAPSVLPTTAVIAIDQLQRLLRTVGGRELRDDRIFDGDGQLRVILHTPNWKDFLDLTFSEIRLYGAGNFQVVRRLRAMIENVSQNVPKRRATLLGEELDLLDRAAHEQYRFPEDLKRSRVSDSQGLGGASA